MVPGEAREGRQNGGAPTKGFYLIAAPSCVLYSDSFLMQPAYHGAKVWMVKYREATSRSTAFCA